MSVMRLSAKLDRTDPGTSWGFRMAGGKDFGTPLVLQRVIPGSLAAKCGLQEGDTITKISGFTVDHLRHKEAQQKIIDSGNSLELTLERSGSSMGGGGVDGSQFNPKPFYQPQPAFNAGPKPFGGGGGGGYSNNSYSQPPPSVGSSYGNSSGSDPHAVPWARGGGGSGSGFSGGGSAGGPWKPRVPTGERHMRVGKAGEARSLPAGGGSARVPMCSSCGTYIRGPFISALDKTWCPDHFICANPSCRAALLNIGFVEEEGQLYCERDYEQFLAPKCGRCSRSIVGEVVNAMRNTFHMGCFVCVQCRQPIGTGSFHNEDGKIYCQKDWAQNFQTKCYGCQFPIEPGDRWVEALSNNWHSECFNCSTCQVNLEGQGFVAKQGKPYCKRHGAGGRF